MKFLIQISKFFFEFEINLKFKTYFIFKKEILNSKF